MGILALFLLWGNTLLVTWAGIREIGRLRARAGAAGEDPGGAVRTAVLLRTVGVATGHLAGILAVSGATAACLHAPFESATSRVGGVLALGVFLLLLPLGTALRDLARRPLPAASRGPA